MWPQESQGESCVGGLERRGRVTVIVNDGDPGLVLSACTAKRANGDGEVEVEGLVGLQSKAVVCDGEGGAGNTRSVAGCERNALGLRNKVCRTWEGELGTKSEIGCDIIERHHA